MCIREMHAAPDRGADPVCLQQRELGPAGRGGRRADGPVRRSAGSRIDELHGNGVRLRFIGEREGFPGRCRPACRCRGAHRRTIPACKLQIAVGYGGRWDIVQCRAPDRGAAAPRRAAAARTSRLRQRSRGALQLAGLPDPDLFIRTGGEKRISNFLLWNLAYTELYFCDELWPDFDRAGFEAALEVLRCAAATLRPDRRPGRGAVMTGSASYRRCSSPRCCLAAVLLLPALLVCGGAEHRPAGGGVGMVARFVGAAPAAARCHSSLRLSYPACCCGWHLSRHASAAAYASLMALPGCSGAWRCCGWLLAAAAPVARCRCSCARRARAFRCLDALARMRCGLAARQPCGAVYAADRVGRRQRRLFRRSRAGAVRKLAPRVSPGKTWAGLWGGLVACALLAASLRLALRACRSCRCCS